MKKSLLELGELRVVEHISKLVRDRLKDKKLEIFGVDDDAQAILVDGLWLFLKIDGTSASSSMYPWLTFSEFGYRVALSAITDLVAKNSKPLLLASSISISGELQLEMVLDVVTGMQELAEASGSLYIGGDINRLSYSDVVVDVASIGISRNPKPSTPFRADLTVHSVKCLGLSSIPAALYYLRRDYHTWKDVLKATAKPEPPLKFFEYSDLVEASTDISDGLNSIRRVLEKSGSDLVLTYEAMCPEVIEFSREEKVELSRLLSLMGEEYTVVSAAEDVDLPTTKIGRTVKGEGRIYFEGRELRGGWDNFLGYTY
ncbi:MAG: AIR synthase related protein [Sulfolobales archaeon]